MNTMNKVMPPAYFLIYLLIAVAIYFFLPFANVIPVPYTYLGIPIILFGFVVGLWAVVLFKKKKTTARPFAKSSTLVTEGPFRISRNPMYLGFVSILLGVTILLGNILVILAPIAMIVTLELLFIPYEEQFLEEKFREEYVKYKKQVRKWL